MDNPAFQNDNGVFTRPKKLIRTNSSLTPTTRSWHLTQAPRSKLCRCNSVVVPQNCCVEDTEGPVSLDYPFFEKKKIVPKNILTDNSLWTKEFWHDSFNRLHHDSGPNFQKFPSNKSEVSTIYDPQFLSSKFNYTGTHHSDTPHKEGWKGVWRWQRVDRQSLSSCQKAAAILFAILLSLLATANILYILRTVGKPIENTHKGTWVDVVLINGEFRITNEPYRLSLANQSSDEFLRVSNLVSHQLDSLFSLSVLSEPYHSTAVTGLLPGPVVGGEREEGVTVHSQLVLRATAHLTASKVGLAFIGGLRNRHGHVWLGNFSIDIQSIGFQASSDAVTWTGWSRWSKCQSTQEFGYVQLRSRNCTLRSGQYLHSTLPCLLVPHSHGNIETAPCPTLPTTPVDVLNPVETNLPFKLINHSGRSERVVLSVESSDKVVPSLTKTVPVQFPLVKLFNMTSTSTTSEQPIKNVTGSCHCSAGEVCVALPDQTTPQCRPVLDTTDPTGCGGHCKINTQLCLKLQDHAFRCVDDSKCLEDEWQCGNQLCIPLSKRCDGHFNCYDHTDEHDCDCLGADQFTCNDSQCIPNHRFCDGFPDCKDHSDEPFGCGGECKTHEWRCSNSRCIQQSKRCDEVNDCGDSSDETECPTIIPE